MIPGWLDEITAEVSSCLETHGSLSVRELATRLGISERTTVEYVALLAAKGQVTIDSVSLSRDRGAGLSRAGTRVPEEVP
jgi:DNA-binding Lrp family transcriptional regulator